MYANPSIFLSKFGSFPLIIAFAQICAKFDLLKVSALLLILSFLFHHACGTAILGPYLKSVISGPAYVSIHEALPFFLRPTIAVHTL